jgi:hypothetical protein
MVHVCKLKYMDSTSRRGEGVNRGFQLFAIFGVNKCEIQFKFNLSRTRPYMLGSTMCIKKLTLSNRRNYVIGRYVTSSTNTITSEVHK